MSTDRLSGVPTPFGNSTTAPDAQPVLADRPGNVGFCLTLPGGFSVWLGPREVPETSFSRRKARSLLKLLALRPKHWLHRDQAMDLLWPDLSPRAAAAQLTLFGSGLNFLHQAFFSDGQASKLSLER